MDSTKQALKRKKKAYYKQSAKKACFSAGRSSGHLCPGMKGFLLTCNNREKECVREGYNLLNEYADKLYGPEQIKNTKTERESSESNSEEDDIESALKQEVEDLKAAKSERRFKQVKSGANNCIFIRTTLEKPEELLYDIVEDMASTMQQKVRFTQRILPIQQTCSAKVENIVSTAEKLYDELVSDTNQDEHSFSVLLKVRNQNKSLNDAMHQVASLVKEKNCLNRVKLTEPDICFLIEVISNIACVSIVKNYYKYRKFNLYELVNSHQRTVATSQQNKVVNESSDEVEANAKCCVQNNVSCLDENSVTDPKDICQNRNVKNSDEEVESKNDIDSQE